MEREDREKEGGEERGEMEGRNEREEEEEELSWVREGINQGELSVTCRHLETMNSNLNYQ